MGEDDKGNDLGKLLKVILSATQGKKTPPSYSYQQPSSGGGGGGRRTITFIAVLVIAVIGFSLATSWTGSIIYAGGLESQIAGLEKSYQDCQDTVTAVTSEKETCGNDLTAEKEKSNGLETDLVNTKNNLIDCTDRESRLQDNFNICSDEVINVTSDLDAEKSNYKSLVRNTVRGVCCSISDILSENVRKFDVNGNQIVCSDEGDHTVNCGTGETNY